MTGPDSPENFKSADCYLLCADESEEVAVVVQHDNTLVGSGGYDEDSAVIVNRAGNRLIDGAFFKEV